MSKNTAHFIGGPMHGMDQALHRVTSTIRFATCGRVEYASNTKPPADLAFEEVLYEEFYREPTDPMKDEWLYLYKYVKPKTRKVIVSPEERIERAKRELDEAQAELTKQAENRRKARCCHCPINARCNCCA